MTNVRVDRENATGLLDLVGDDILVRLIPSTLGNDLYWPHVLIGEPIRNADTGQCPIGTLAEMIQRVEAVVAKQTM